MSESAPEAYRYGAFISYRHEEPDRSWAQWLHTALETYRTPKALVRQQGLPERLGRVFLDEQEVPASHNLPLEIETALVASRTLIVVCSPRAPVSKWMDREIARFRELGRQDRVLALLIEGEPRTAFPPSLRSMRQAMVDATGADVGAAIDVEPLAADVRPRQSESGGQLKHRARLSLAAAMLGCRFDDLRRRDLERRWKRLRWVAVGLGALVLTLGLLTAWALQAREEADRERDEVLRLADVKAVRDLVREVDTLWPVAPGPPAKAMTRWLERARQALANRSQHEAARKRLREHPEDSSDERTTVWRTEVLEELLAGLDALEDPRQASKGLIAEVGRRREAAVTLHKRSIEEHAAKWDETTQAVAKDPRYGRVRLRPQLGLVPLGPDPDSHFYEFAHLGSGSIPRRDDATGKLLATDDSAIVLVLLPGGTFRMGAQSDDPAGPNYVKPVGTDEHKPVESDDWPVHEVTLSPFFLGKHECTRAQWMGLTGGRDPSSVPVGAAVAERAVTLRSPVEQVSWDACVGSSGWLTRHRLTLPSEAQWEYACRAGSSTPWSYGPDVSSLQGAANYADQWAKKHDWPSSWSFTPELNDGHRLYAPVGSFRANDFGLYDMHGNVWEWCRDCYGRYSSVGAKDPVCEEGEVRVHRGGGWSSTALQGRSSSRRYVMPSLESDGLGFRVARPIDDR